MCAESGRYIISTSGGTALQAMTWKLSVQDALEEDSGWQELMERNQENGQARLEHRRVRAQEGPGTAGLEKHRINPPHTLGRQVGKGGAMTCTEGLSKNTLGLAAAAEPARRKPCSHSVSLNFLCRQAPPAPERLLTPGLLWVSVRHAIRGWAGSGGGRHC